MATDLEIEITHAGMVCVQDASVLRVDFIVKYILFILEYKYGHAFKEILTCLLGIFTIHGTDIHVSVC